MKSFKLLSIAVALVVLGAVSASSAKADGWYVSGSGSGGAYWDPGCACWIYPSYAYRPVYPTYPAYTSYSYPSYYYPYYSRPSISIGFSGGYGYSSPYYGGYYRGGYPYYGVRRVRR